MAELIKNVVVVKMEDGTSKYFDSKAEAVNFLRRPKIKTALGKITDNEELVDWLLDHQETVEIAFETGSIRRVTKVEAGRLAKALEEVKEIANPKLAFLQENADAIRDSFKWPVVKRLSAEEKNTEAKRVLLVESENEELADWVINNKDAVLEAYAAGVIKREVTPQAAEGLAAYRAKMAQKKIDRANAEAAGPEALAAYLEKEEQERIAEAEAKKNK